MKNIFLLSSRLFSAFFAGCFPLRALRELPLAVNSLSRKERKVLTQRAQRKRLGYFTLLFCLFGGLNVAKAGDPGWAVTPGNYQYSMTFTSIANIACVELKNSGNKIGAFVGGVCRGVVQTNVVSGGRNYAFLVIYSNISSGEKVSFRIYDIVKDSVSYGLDSIIFSSSSIVGSLSNPYVVYTNHAPTDIVLHNDSIKENEPVGTVISNLTTVDVDLGSTHTYSLTPGMFDNSEFSITGNFLYSDTIFNYEITKTRKIEIIVEDNNGCMFTKQFNIGIQDVFENPDSMLLSGDTVYENRPIHTFVGTLATFSDPDTANHYTYTLVSGPGSTHNSYFMTSNDSLYTDSVHNFENIPLCSIRIQSKGTKGDSIVNQFQIKVFNVNEKPYLTLDSFSVSEAAAVDFEIGQLAFTDVDAGSVCTYYLVTPNIPFKVDSVTGKVLVGGALDYETTKTYDLQLAIKDNGTPALFDTVTMKVTIEDAVEDGILPSTDFVSPNMDGKNDFWMIRNVELYADFSLDIMDEYGQKVYSIGSGYNNEWDAYMNGKPLPTGNYYYTFRNSNTGQLFKGTITVAQ